LQQDKQIVVEKVQEPPTPILIEKTQESPIPVVLTTPHQNPTPVKPPEDIQRRNIPRFVRY
jgi:hypothetical protein